MTTSAPQPAERSDRFAQTAPPDWTRSPGLAAGAAVALIIAAVGLVSSRVDLALLALPLVAAVVVSWNRRPPTGEDATVAVTLSEPSANEIGYALEIAAPERTEAVVLRYGVLGAAEHELVVTCPPPGDLGGEVPLLHSGPQELVRVSYRFLSADAALSSTPPKEPVVAARAIAPSQLTIGSLPLPRHLQGLTGIHESSRAGDGGDFRDIHPFTPGDRLRRIDWKATARHGRNPGDLYIRRTSALAEATVLIVLDSFDDVGEQVAEWNRNAADKKGLSSLDLAREAAGAIASGYIRAGDRVGFQDLSSRARMIAHAGGRRHLWKVLRAIETTAPAADRFRHQRAPIVPPGALVYLLTSLLDDRAIGLGLIWRGNGHRVIAVDVLPAPRFARSTRYERIAHRILMMEREDRIRTLHAGGIEILRWSEDGSPRQARLHQLSRPSRQGGREIGGRR